MPHAPLSKPDPMGITVDAADRVYIADTDNDRLDMFTTTLS